MGKLMNYNDLLLKNKKSIDCYMDTLLQWNKRINLIGKSTIDDMWNRHIVDSAQLMKFFTMKELENCSFADFGSGAGFPGLVLSILGVKNMTLIEKSIQKCNFLKNVVGFSQSEIKILNKNIFDIKNTKFNIIVSRALASVNDLLTMVKPFLSVGGRCIFLKGKKIQNELLEAKKHHNFNYELFDSETSSEGKIVVCSF